MKARIVVCRVALVVLGLIAPALWAQDGIGGAVARFGADCSFSRELVGPRLITADFDNDHRPDGAVLFKGGRLHGQSTFRIELHVTSDRNQELVFESTETALTISAIDVNRDGNVDIVVERAFTHDRLLVWLNDGHGSFRKTKIDEFVSSGQREDGGWTVPSNRQRYLPIRIHSKSRSRFLKPDVAAAQDSPSSGRCPRAPAFRALGASETLNPPRGPPLLLSL